MGKQAKIHQIEKAIAARSNGKARDLPVYQLPPAALRRLTALSVAAQRAKSEFDSASSVRVIMKINGTDRTFLCI